MVGSGDVRIRRHHGLRKLKGEQASQLAAQGLAPRNAARAVLLRPRGAQIRQGVDGVEARGKEVFSQVVGGDGHGRERPDNVVTAKRYRDDTAKRKRAIAFG